MECEIPRVNSNRDEMRKYFEECKTIAVIGCSPKPEKASNRVAKYLVEVGYEMIPVYPKGDKILGQKVYKSLADIDKPVDMVVVFRKPAVVLAVADACIARGDVKVLWTQLEIINNEAAEKAKDSGIAVVQNYCAMVEHKAIFN
ncbi:CoA-binding protein [Sulfurovum sp. bin170]|uniref:CoA-binding protein n=1 Tax=Sulfurovum sp. bin170 TaxID=2695268 RepID=UPI0013E04B8E|nr:CoA-binding protein [Sulfurovum sp. bin170]NEW61623.1 CoA-binding protein [Sulfurovum sp. bin170]